ncbi:hypothetical protein [Acinetobacter variabilis]|uniref:Uncharacterized protein n=1 Tax=Acinetobacter variabilis TaxID=70346 RepID=N8WR21_9GAMM|nr:hypothetical protein [Acinetobacter variabilis]ENU99358.1 hypothetical protein F969_01677 [Acinetobacter variabilis]
MMNDQNFVNTSFSQQPMIQLTPQQMKYNFFTGQIIFLGNQIASLGASNPTLTTELLKTYLELNKALINSDLQP